MIFNLKFVASLRSAIELINRWQKDGYVVEINIYRFKRTLKQNAYLHLCLDYFGARQGFTTEESKIVILRELGYYYEHNGFKFVKKTSEMNVEEMSGLISRFKEYVELNCGYSLPDAERYTKDYVYQVEIKNEIDSARSYLDGRHRE